MAKIKALGTIFKFNSVAVGSLTSIGEITPEAEEIDATCLDSAGGYKEYVQGFKDSGEVPVTGFFDKTDAGQTAMRTGFTTGAASAVLVTFPDGSTVTANGWVKSFSIGSAEVDGLVGFTATVRLTGSVTVA